MGIPRTFCDYLQHFAKHLHASTDQKKLLILDNHESHILVNALEFAKKNCIVLLTIPPHFSHRLQPLDVSVNFSFKAQYNRAIDNWMLSNLGKAISIYSIAGLVGSAFPLAFTPSNIQSGFARSSIWPYNPGVFTE